MKKQTISFTLLAAGFLLGATALSALASGNTWTAPSQSPPNGNVAAPINVGPNTITQIKTDGLIITGTLALKSLVVNPTSGSVNDNWVLTSSGGNGTAVWAQPTGGSSGNSSSLRTKSYSGTGQGDLNLGPWTACVLTGIQYGNDSSVGNVATFVTFNNVASASVNGGIVDNDWHLINQVNTRHTGALCFGQYTTLNTSNVSCVVTPGVPAQGHNLPVPAYANLTGTVTGGLAPYTYSLNNDSYPADDMLVSVPGSNVNLSGFSSNPVYLQVNSTDAQSAKITCSGQ